MPRTFKGFIQNGIGVSKFALAISLKRRLFVRRKELVRKVTAGRVILYGLAVWGILIGVVVGSANLKASQAAYGSQGQASWVAPPSAEKIKNPVSPNATSLEAGKKIFTDNCASCHGATGKGDGPVAAGLLPHPADLTSSAVQQQTDGALFYKISEGRSLMPSFTSALTEHQRWDVVNHIRTLAPKREKGS
jgi:mono/diheme cytochrome c family protein